MLHPTLYQLLSQKRKRMNKIQKSLPMDKGFQWQFPYAIEKSLATLIEERTREVLTPYLSYIRSNGDIGVRVDQSYEDLDQYSYQYQQFVQSQENDEKEDNKLILLYASLYLFNRKELFRFTNNLIGIDFEGNNVWNDGQERLFMKLAQSEIRKNVIQFIERLRIIMIRDSVRKKTWKETWETIQSKTIDFYEKKLPLIARNMVGNAFSFMQRNMLSVLGINFYRWKTAGDEAVRKTHRPLEGKICRWDNASLYSTDGVTWQEKTNDMVKKHPSEDYNCRCVALPHLKNEIKEIDNK